MTKSLVSVVVPVFNRELYICDTLDSILSQTYQDIEIVAVNDGSTDNSLNLLEDYKQRYPEKISIINQSNQGQVAARNAAIAVSRGAYVAFLDSDDLWLPEKLEKQMPLFCDDVGLVYCAVYNIDESGRTVGMTPCETGVRGKAYLRMLTSNQMTGGTVVLSRAAIDAVGSFDESLSAAENWDLWLRVSKRFSIDYVDEPLVKYRKHSGNMSKDHELMMNAIEQILAKHCKCSTITTEEDSACRIARANYEYRNGVHYFSRYECQKARGYFRNALALQPNFKDARARLLRTYLGASGNRLLAAVKAVVSS